MSTADGSQPVEGPFSPGWVALTGKTSETPNTTDEAKSAKKQTPSHSKATPKARHTSPKSEFNYDDAYSIGGDDFDESESYIYLQHLRVSYPIIRSFTQQPSAELKPEQEEGPQKQRAFRKQSNHS